MTIQYRCHCGQEVILRPRESTYLVVAAILALSLVNVVFTGLLWQKIDGFETVTTEPATAREAADPASRAPQTADAETGNGAGTGTPTEPPAPVAEAAAPERVAVDAPLDEATGSAGLEPETADSTTADPAPASTHPHEASGGEAPAVRRVAPSGGVGRAELPPPAGCDGLALWLLLQEPPDDRVDRAAVLLAGARWGSGFLRERASERLREDPGLGVLAAAVDDAARAADDRALRIDPGPDAAPHIVELVAGLREDWSARWQRLLGFEHTAARARLWVEDQRASVAGPADVLLLVDLSESMAVEIVALRTVLRRMVPLTVAAEGGWRWGWIGYRDEVVENTGLFDDADAFLASLDRWRSEGGGDVPEGVDRAVFEALRFGSVAWRPHARHRLLVVGDAPPLYERIAPMVSLVKAAHGSPEQYEVNCLGIIRESQFPFVPGFEDLAAGAGGRCIYIRAGESPADAVWRLLAGALPDAWRECPLE